ncbi:MAG: hypothetical protein HGB21_11155 [Nitrospirae bacterium]|nr:hypothetical protein [Nitrospirota bacterium]NTW66843.1 hypothetical protein [Nitrospirota bacterium]
MRIEDHLQHAAESFNHPDMDIFLETTIDRQAYILHCFRAAKQALGFTGMDRL